MQHSKSVSSKSLLKLAEANIQLDSYNDIFSDFDPSPYSERRLSDDFVLETKKFSITMKGNKMLLRLLMPKKERNEQEEKAIIKRLHDHFKDAYEILSKEASKTKMWGTLLLFGGAICMGVASYLSFVKQEQFIIHFLKVLFEPAAWFLLWTGMDRLLSVSKHKKQDLKFYLLMAKADIRFFAY